MIQNTSLFCTPSCFLSHPHNNLLLDHPQSVPNLPWLKTKFQGPATVQIAVPSAAIVVQLVDNKGNPSAATASILQTVLADESIVKAGVGIDQDMLELYREWGCTFDIKNRFDIGGIGATNSQTLSLKNLTQAIVNVELQKSRKLAMSNWGQVPLTEAQISYCARDAWAAAVIMTELAERDPDTFATAPLIHRLSNELCIEDLDKRAKGRKAAKTRFIEIVGKGADKVPLQDLSGPLRKEVGELEEVMRALAPPTPFRFDMSLLECDLN